MSHSKQGEGIQWSDGKKLGMGHVELYGKDVIMLLTVVLLLVTVQGVLVFQK